MNNKTLLMLAAAGVAIWYFFIRKDANGKTPASTFAPLTPRPSTSNSVAQVAHPNASGAQNQKNQFASLLSGVLNGTATTKDIKSGASSVLDWFKGSPSTPATPSSNNPVATSTGSILGPDAPSAENPGASNTGTFLGPTQAEIQQGQDARNQANQTFTGEEQLPPSEQRRNILTPGKHRRH